MENEWIMTVAFYVDAMVFARGLVFRGSEYSSQSAYVGSEVRYMERVIKEHRGWKFSEFPSLGRAYKKPYLLVLEQMSLQWKSTLLNTTTKNRFKHFECCTAMLEYRRVAHDEQCSKSKLSLDIPFWLVNWILTVAWWIILITVSVPCVTLGIASCDNTSFDHCSHDCFCSWWL